VRRAFRVRFYAVECPHVTSVPFVTHQGGPGSCLGLNVKVVYWGARMAATVEERRALVMVATAGHNGATSLLLAVRGFDANMITGLVNQGSRR
jgi:hypothetical protein